MPACRATSAWPMLWSEEAYTLNMRLDSPIGRVAYKNGHPDFAGCPIAMRQAHDLYCGRRRLNAESAIRLPDRKGSIQKRAPRLCRMPACYATSAWPMLRSEGAYTLNMRLDPPVRRVEMLEPAEGLCRANDSGVQCVVTPPGDESQGYRRSQASSVARGSHRRLRVSWAYRLRGSRASSVFHLPGGECLAHLSFS